MSTKEHVAQLTAQIATLQAQLAHCSRSPPPPQPSAAPPPPPKPPKVSAPSPFSGAQDDLDCVMTGSPGDRKALRGQQTWAQPLGWPLSHWVCWVVSEMVRGYHS